MIRQLCDLPRQRHVTAGENTCDDILKGHKQDQRLKDNPER